MNKKGEKKSITADWSKKSDLYYMCIWSYGQVLWLQHMQST